MRHTIRVLQCNEITKYLLGQDNSADAIRLKALGMESGRFEETFSIEFEGLTCGKLRNSTVQADLHTLVAGLLGVRKPELRITNVQAGHTPVRPAPVCPDSRQKELARRVKIIIYYKSR